VETLIYVYPAFILGLVAGAASWWRSWPPLWVYGLGSIIFIALVAHQTTVPDVCPVGAECEPAPPFIWAMLAFVNVGAWMVGVALGVAIADPIAHAVQGRRRSN
jgi:hypothetical protein